MIWLGRSNPLARDQHVDKKPGIEFGDPDVQRNGLFLAGIAKTEKIPCSYN